MHNRWPRPPRRSPRAPPAERIAWLLISGCGCATREQCSGVESSREESVGRRTRERARAFASQSKLNFVRISFASVVDSAARPHLPCHCQCGSVRTTHRPVTHCLIPHWSVWSGRAAHRSHTAGAFSQVYVTSRVHMYAHCCSAAPVRPLSTCVRPLCCCAPAPPAQSRAACCPVLPVFIALCTAHFSHSSLSLSLSVSVSRLVSTVGHSPPNYTHNTAQVHKARSAVIPAAASSAPHLSTCVVLLVLCALL